MGTTPSTAQTVYAARTAATAVGFSIAFFTLTLLGNDIAFLLEWMVALMAGLVDQDQRVAGILGRIGHYRMGPNRPSEMGFVGWFDVKAEILNSINVVFCRKNASQSR